MRNKLSYLGFLGILGLTGISTDHHSMLGFFGFFAYFAYLGVEPDELFVQNLQKSATAGFFTGLPLWAITITLGLVFSSPELFIIGVALSFAAVVMVFTIYLSLLEWREKRNLSE